MVQTKKRRLARKDAGTQETVEPVLVVAATDEADKPQVLSGDPTKVKLLSGEETAWKLLSDAPEVPELRTVEEAVEFVDRYARWMRDVKGAKR